MEGSCCPSCGSYNVVEDEHEGQALVVCSDCGHVTADTAQANLTLNYGDLLTNDGPTGVVLHAHDAGGIAGRAGAGYFRGAVGQYRWRDKARAMADQLALTRQHRDLLVDLVDLIQSHGHQHIFGWDPLIAACAYIVMRQQLLPFTLRDVAVATNIHVCKIARCMRKVLLACRIQLPPNNLHALVMRHLAALLARAPPSAPCRPASSSAAASTPAAAAAHPVTQAALQLLDYIAATGSLPGCSPLCVAAAAIRLAVEAHVPSPQQQQWLLAHANAALNLSCHTHSGAPVQALKASLLSHAPLLPHLPPDNALAMVRNLPDVLHLNALLASLACRPPSPDAAGASCSDRGGVALPAAAGGRQAGVAPLPLEPAPPCPLRAWPAAQACGQVCQQGQPEHCDQDAAVSEQACQQGQPEHCSPDSATLGQACQQGQPAHCSHDSAALGQACQKGQPEHCSPDSAALGQACQKGQPEHCSQDSAALGQACQQGQQPLSSSHDPEAPGAGPPHAAAAPLRTGSGSALPSAAAVGPAQQPAPPGSTVRQRGLAHGAPAPPSAGAGTDDGAAADGAAAATSSCTAVAGPLQPAPVAAAAAAAAAAGASATASTATIQETASGTQPRAPSSTGSWANGNKLSYGHMTPLLAPAAGGLQPANCAQGQVGWREGGSLGGVPEPWASARNGKPSASGTLPQDAGLQGRGGKARQFDDSDGGAPAGKRSCNWVEPASALKDGSGVERQRCLSS